MSQNNNPYSLGSVLGFITNNFAIIVLVLIFFAGGVAAGSIWKENQLLKGGSGSRVAANDPSAPAALPPSGPEGPSEAQLAAVPPVSNDDYVRGNKNAKITIVEYSDYECPFCQRFHPTMLQVMEEYGNDVAWVYRHFPLDFHPNAQRAAEAAECVGKASGGDAYWTYTDVIFEKNAALGGKLTPAAIDEAIAEATSNVDAVNNCLNSGEMADRVAEHMSTAQAAGVSGTPGSFVVTKDGAQELIPGALPFTQIQTILDQYL